MIFPQQMKITCCHSLACYSHYRFYPSGESEASADSNNRPSHQLYNPDQSDYNSLKDTTLIANSEMLDNTSSTKECLEMVPLDQQSHESANQSVNGLDHQNTANVVDQSKKLCEDSSEKSVKTDFSDEVLQSQVEFTGKDNLVDNDQLTTDLGDLSELSDQSELTDTKDASENSLKVQPIYKQQIQPTAIVVSNFTCTYVMFVL